LFLFLWCLYCQAVVEKIGDDMGGILDTLYRFFYSEQHTATHQMPTLGEIQSSSQAESSYADFQAQLSSQLYVTRYKQIESEVNNALQAFYNQQQNDAMTITHNNNAIKRLVKEIDTLQFISFIMIATLFGACLLAAMIMDLPPTMFATFAAVWSGYHPMLIGLPVLTSQIWGMLAVMAGTAIAISAISICCYCLSQVVDLTLGISDKKNNMLSLKLNNEILIDNIATRSSGIRANVHEQFAKMPQVSQSGMFAYNPYANLNDTLEQALHQMEGREAVAPEYLAPPVLLRT